MHYVLGLLRDIRDTRVRCASWVYAKRFYIVQLNCFWRSFFLFFAFTWWLLHVPKASFMSSSVSFLLFGEGSHLAIPAHQLHLDSSDSCAHASMIQFHYFFASRFHSPLFKSFFIWIIWLYFSISYSFQLNTYTLARLWIQCLKTSCTWRSSPILISRTYVVHTHTHIPTISHTHTYRLALTRDKR